MAGPPAFQIRVLRGDQGLGGYRWGVERKRTLLATARGRPVTG